MSFSPNIKKLGYWLSCLGLVSALLLLPPQAYSLYDSISFSQQEGNTLTYKVDANYENTNGRLLYLEKKSAENEATATQKSRDDIAYREKMQESMSQVLQSLVRLETRANIQSDHVNRNDP